MAELAFEHFATRNPYFFEHPDAAPEKLGLFEVSLPLQWRRIVEPEWTHAIARDVVLPEQGWKIHVSSIPDHARSVLSAAAEVLTEENVTFKHLSSVDRLAARNSKITPRGHAGKFLTAYPRAEALERILDRLEQALQEFSGPYILSDKRWKLAPVYLRYGAFRPLYVQAVGGVDLPAIRNSITGKLVPDERNGFFSAPEWAPVPEFLKEWVDRPGAEDSAMPFNIVGAVKFSSAGGTYRGTTPDGETNLIVKEARAHIAHDFLGRNAIQRLTHEIGVLEELSSISAVPNITWHGMLWENLFAALEHKPGIPLRTWVVANFPAYSMSTASAVSYLQSIRKISGDLRTALDDIHAHGWAHFDVHGDNILVSEQLDVSLIDLECAIPCSAQLVEQTIAASGFRAFGMRTPAQTDWHGLRQTLAFMLVPLIRQTELVPDYSHQTRRLAASIFPDVPAVRRALNDVLADLEWLDDQAGDVEAAVHTRQDRWKLEPVLTPFVTEDALLAATLDGYDDLREKWNSSERRFPVHVYGLSQKPTGLAYGDAGVMAGRITAQKSLSGSRTACISLEWDELAEDLFTHAGASTPPGLFSGAVGDLWGLASAGRHGQVLEIIEARAAAWLEAPGSRVYDGLPGILLALLRLKQHGLVPESQFTAIRHALDSVADAYLRAPEAFAPIGKVRSNKGNMPDLLDSGLLYGHLGIGWLFAEAARTSSNSSYLETVNLALGYELTAYQYDDASKTLQLSEGTRTLPYLATGSAGFGIVLPLLERNSVDPDVVESASFLLNATKPPFSVFPGLFAGYAGLALGAAGLSHFLGLPPESAEPTLRRLSAYAARSGKGVVFAGDSGIRITADFASGGAGIAFAVAQLAAGRFDLLPPIDLPCIVPGETRNIPNSQGGEK